MKDRVLAAMVAALLAIVIIYITGVTLVAHYGSRL